MEEEINLAEYGRVLGKRWRLLSLVVILITSGVFFYSLSLPDLYQSSATFIPVGGQPASSGALATIAQLGLGGLLGGGGAGGLGQQLQAILRSRSLAERVIQKHDLLRHFYPQLWDEERQAWKQQGPPDTDGATGMMKQRLTLNEDPALLLTTISAEHENPKIAAEIVQSYLTELAAYLEENTLTEAKRNRIFIENQLERNKAELLELGKKMTVFYATNRISNVIPKVDVDVSMVTMESGAAERRTVVDGYAGEPVKKEGLGWPGVADASAQDQEKVEVLRRKVQDLEREIKKTNVIKDVPQQVYLQYLALRRDLLVNINSLLAQQYELAKITEAKEDLRFQVIDPPKIPEGKSRPQRFRMTLLGLFASLLAAVFCAFAVEYLERSLSLSFSSHTLRSFGWFLRSRLKR